MNVANTIPQGITSTHDHRLLKNTTHIHNLNYLVNGCISGESKNTEILLSIYKLRHRVFSQRLLWDVSSINGYEKDKFDNSDASYIYTTDSDNNVKGCVRLLPTTVPYMLSEIFPSLWQSNSPLPSTATIYELSRFAFDKEQQSEGYGFSPSVIKLLRSLVLYAKDKNVEKYVFVTTTVIERMLKIQGICIERVGSAVPMHNAKTIVVFMNINKKTEDALF